LITEYTFNNLNLRKISLVVVKTNKSAIAVYKKLKFIVEGEMREQFIIDKKPADILIMSRLNL